MHRIGMSSNNAEIEVDCSSLITLESRSLLLILQPGGGFGTRRFYTEVADTHILRSSTSLS